MRTVIITALSCCALVACSEPPPAPQPQPQGPSLEVQDQGAVLPLDHPPVGGFGGGEMTGGGGGATGGGGGAVGGGGGATGGGGGALTAPGVQRLSVRQLAQSLPVVLGGNTWMVGTAQGFNARSATLGEADYLGVVDENLEASALYQKFMADAARDGCTRTANADGALAQNQRVLMRFVGPSDTVATNAAGVDENLRYLKLRFHGVKVHASDLAKLAGLRTVFTSAVTGAAGAGTPTAAHVKEGWRAVCVALLTAPEYHLY